jgi:hypothetical protein
MTSDRSNPGAGPTPNAQFLVFTNWALDKNVGNWSPFDDAATISVIKKEINESLDRQLHDVVRKEDRFYFRHLNHGIESIDTSKKPNWRKIHGMIVDVSSAQNDPVNSEKLDLVAHALERVAPAYSRLGVGILACLIKKVAEVPVAVRRPAFALRQPLDSDELKDEIAAWLVDVSWKVECGRVSDDKELWAAATAYYEASLLTE